MTSKSDEDNYKCNDPECDCGDDCDCEEHEIEVVELEDENGDKEEFAILDEIEFEGRHFVIMAPLAEVKALHDAEADGREADEDSVEFDLSIEIFEIEGDDYTILEDEELAKRLMEHLDERSQELDED